jgi:hypothetical protein
VGEAAINIWAQGKLKLHARRAQLLVLCNGIWRDPFICGRLAADTSSHVACFSPCSLGQAEREQAIQPLDLISAAAGYVHCRTHALLIKFNGFDFVSTQSAAGAVCGLLEISRLGITHFTFEI